MAPSPVRRGTQFLFQLCNLPHEALRVSDGRAPELGSDFVVRDIMEQLLFRLAHDLAVHLPKSHQLAIANKYRAHVLAESSPKVMQECGGPNSLASGRGVSAA